MRGFSLVEIMVSLGLSAIVLVVLFLMLRGGTRQFELSSSQVFLGQRTRDAVVDSLGLAASTVTPLTEAAQAVYSPTPNCSEDSGVYPNIYCLDFVSCCDFLDSRFADQPEQTEGYLDRRGGTRFRYRIRYDVVSQDLVLERLVGTSPGPPALPSVDTRVAPRVLCRALQRVTFAAVGPSVHMNVEAATVKKDGARQGGLPISDGRTSLDTAGARQTQARRLELFTTVMIPSRTIR